MYKKKVVFIFLCICLAAADEEDSGDLKLTTEANTIQYNSTESASAFPAKDNFGLCALLSSAPFVAFICYFVFQLPERLET